MSSRMSPAPNDKFEAFRMQLESLKDELSARVRALARDGKVALDRNVSEQAIELENRDVALALDAEAKEELADIEKALQRLASGEYGQCVRCGEAIARERLAAAPAAAKCIACANEATAT